MPVDRLYNFWLCVLLGLSPLLVVSHIWLAVFHHSKSSSSQMGGRSSSSTPSQFGRHRPVRCRVALPGGESLGTDGAAGLAAVQCARHHLLYRGLPARHAPRGYLECGRPQTVVNVFFLPFLLVLNVIIALILRNFRAYVIRRVEGSVASSNKFHDKWMQRACVRRPVRLLLCLSRGATTTAKPIVPTDLGLNGTSPCDLITGPTWSASVTCGRSPASLTTAHLRVR